MFFGGVATWLLEKNCIKVKLPLFQKSRNLKYLPNMILKAIKKTMKIKFPMVTPRDPDFVTGHR